MGRSCRGTNVGGGKSVSALRNHNHDWNNGIEIDLNMRSYFYPTNTARSSHPKSILIASIVNGDCGLRQFDRRFIDRPVWTVGGDWGCLNTDDELERAILYAGEAQDRMEYK